MSDSDVTSLIQTLVWTSVFLCCCCIVPIGGGVGAFFYFRNRNKNKPAAAAVINAQPLASTPVAPVTPPASEPSIWAPPPPAAEPPPPPPSVAASTAAVEPPPPPAGPIDDDDIRAKLLALNGPDKPYVVQATGYKIAIAPGAVTGYLLEISFNYAEKTARFVEIGPAGDPQLKLDARQALEAEGWTVRE